MRSNTYRISFSFFFSCSSSFGSGLVGKLRIRRYRSSGHVRQKLNDTLVHKKLTVMMNS